MDWSKWDLLKERIFKEGSLLVSFSGGVDSSLLAKTAKDVLGQNALCIILDTETMPRSELKYAQDLAKSLDLNCLVVRYSMAEDEQFQKMMQHAATSARKSPPAF